MPALLSPIIARICYRKVIRQHYDEIGHVSGLFIDRDERKVRMLQVAAGGFVGLSERCFLVPVEAVSNVTGRGTHQPDARSRSELADVKPEPQGSSRPQVLKTYYGYAPSWGGLGHPR